MRRVILVEGPKYPDGTQFDPGSLECPEDEVAVVFNFDFQNVKSIMGKARDFQRAEDGTITMDFDINEDRLVLMDDLSARVYANRVVKSGDYSQRDIVVTHCELRAIGMVLKDTPWHPGYPDE